MVEIKRVNVELSDEKKAQLKRWQAQIKEELPELSKRLRMANEAAEENSLSGALRRAIHASGFPLEYIAKHVGTTSSMLDEFLTGERTLRSDLMDRLALLLGCTLHQEEDASPNHHAIASTTS
jgi:hypothetical protein